MKRLKEELEEARPFTPGDRVRTPDGLFGVVEAVEAARIIVKDAESETRWIYPRGTLPGDPAGKEG